jgi:hypothetical protein
VFKDEIEKNQFKKISKIKKKWESNLIEKKTKNHKIIKKSIIKIILDKTNSN